MWYEYGIRTLGVFVDDLLQNAPLTLATILALVLVYAVNWLVFVPFEINQVITQTQFQTIRSNARPLLTA